MTAPTKFESDVQRYTEARDALQEVRRGVRATGAMLEVEDAQLAKFDEDTTSRRAALERTLAERRADFERMLLEERASIEARSKALREQLERQKLEALTAERRWLSFADRIGKSLYAEVSGTRTPKSKLELTQADFEQTDDAEALGEAVPPPSPAAVDEQTDVAPEATSEVSP